MSEVENTHLTERQYKIYKRWREGEDPSEIADDLETSKSNVSHILKSAKENIKKSRKTVELVDTLDWPLEMDFEPGEDIFDVSKEVYRRADGEGIHLNYTGAELADLLAKNLKKDIQDRKILIELKIRISEEGEVRAFIR